jgi:hypothetical protein
MTAPPAPPWSIPAAAHLAAVEAGPGGLSGAEAARRLARRGPNQLEGRRRASAGRALLGQLRSPLVLLLLVAAAISLGVGARDDRGLRAGHGVGQALAAWPAAARAAARRRLTAGRGRGILPAWGEADWYCSRSPRPRR